MTGFGPLRDVDVKMQIKPIPKYIACWWGIGDRDAERRRGRNTID